MDILQLRYFRTVAYHQSISKAAAELHVSQPALSNMISRLEADLGTQLFDRVGRKLVLNHSGELFYQTTKHVFHLLDDSAKNLKMQSEARGLIRICSRINCAELFFDIATFSMSYPDVQFRFYGAEKLKGDPLRSSYDFIVLPDYETREMPAIQIGRRHSLFAVLPRIHRFANRKHIDLKELANEYFVFVSPRDSRLEQAYDLCIESGFTPKVRYICDSGTTHQGLLLGGSCIGLIYNTTPIYQQHWDDLITIPVDCPTGIERKINLVWNPEGLTETNAIFLDFMRELHPE